MTRIAAASVFLALFLVSVAVLSASASPDYNIGWMPSDSTCKGSIAECLATEDEFQLDSESTRRMLFATKYISYSALLRNSVPCSYRGASYYNCKPSARANPYTRGCSAITRCRS